MSTPTALHEFLTLNRAASADRPDSSAWLLVDAAYAHPYTVAVTMRVADVVARLTGTALAVVTAPRMPRMTAEVIASFSPKRVVSARTLATRGLGGRLAAILKAVARTRRGEDLVALQWEGAPIGQHLYDTLLMRFGSASASVLTARHRTHLFLELGIADGFRALAEQLRPSMALVPDNVYRNGVFFELLAARRVPMLACLDINGLSAHYYREGDSTDVHCRTPDAELLDLVCGSPALFEQAEQYLRRRTEGREVQHDLLRAYDPRAVSVDREHLCRLLNLTGAKPIVLVAAHIFRDAPHACAGLLHRDYEAWVLDTCRLLRQNPHVDFVVKEHPSSELYGEEGLLSGLLSQAGVADRMLPMKVNTRSLFSSVDVVITCGGTAGAEFPCFGVPVLLASGAPYDALGYAHRAGTIQEYETEIGRLQLYDKLGAEAVRKARAALFVMNVVARIPKADLGLGNQPYMLGRELKFEVFLHEAVAEMKAGAGQRRLTEALGDLLSGPFRNLVDARLVGSELRAREALVSGVGAS